MKKILICLLCVLLLCGCSARKEFEKTSDCTIVTTIFPLYDFARQIVGEKMDVKMLIKPGSEVHSYDPLPSDMKSVLGSDLFLYVGGESDKWVDTLLNDTSVTTLSLIDCVKPHNHNHSDHHTDEHHTDEHIWTSPENAAVMLKKICEKIIEIDTKNADYYQKNCDNYIKKIGNASQKIEDVVSGFDNPFILVADRFPFVYFAEQYKINYEAAFDGCAVSTDISFKTMSRLTKTIKSKNVKTVFVTELSSKNIANALNKEFCVRVVELHSAHNVSLADYNSGITYVDILYRNCVALKEGICDGTY